MGNITIKTVIEKIEEAKANEFLPRNWASIIAKRTNLTDTAIRNYASGKKNVPEGPMLVLEHLNRIIEEQKLKAKKLTA